MNTQTKSNYQKMIDQDNYDAMDPELIQLRKQARILTKRYNFTNEDQESERQIIIKQLFGKIQEPFKIEPPFQCDYGCNIKVGKNFYMNFNCCILDCAEVEVGDNVMCGPNVQIYTPGHPLNAQERISGIEFAKKIKIGHNVWLGGSVIICPGVTIGDNTVIGAGSVVTKDIQSDVVAAGNPCKIIKYLK